MTNKQFAATDDVFKRACDLENLLPTSRQASKYLMRKGKAYCSKATAVREIEKEFNDNPRTKTPSTK